MNRLNTQRTNILGGELRFLRTGRGPTVVLLHTLRTQLEYFIPLMSALDQDREILAPDLGCRWLPLDRLLPTLGTAAAMLACAH
jgi:hypothetical protein